jgi:hypothetical protein
MTSSPRISIPLAEIFPKKPEDYGKRRGKYGARRKNG